MREKSNKPRGVVNKSDTLVSRKGAQKGRFESGPRATRSEAKVTPKKRPESVQERPKRAEEGAKSAIGEPKKALKKTPMKAQESRREVQDKLKELKSLPRQVPGMLW